MRRAGISGEVVFESSAASAMKVHQILFALILLVAGVPALYLGGLAVFLVPEARLWTPFHYGLVRLILATQSDDLGQLLPVIFWSTFFLPLLYFFPAVVWFTAKNRTARRFTLTLWLLHVVAAGIMVSLGE